MERRRNGFHPTVLRQERFRGTGRVLPSMDQSSGRLERIKLPDSFPGPDSTEEEVREYILGSKPYSHRGYWARITASHGLNHNSHH